jgi:hypothetical protein
MVDIERRKKLALYLRHLATGQISNDDFENAVMDNVTYGWLPDQYYRSQESKTDDSVIRPVLEYAWCLYNDTENHKLTGHHKLTEFQEKEIARLILFLHSGQSYTWDYVDITNPLLRLSFKDIMQSILTFGLHYREKRLTREQQIEEMKKKGDFEYWPFKTKEDFEEQLKRQPFLVGQ